MTLEKQLIRLEQKINFWKAVLRYLDYLKVSPSFFDWMLKHYLLFLLIQILALVYALVVLYKIW